MAKKPNRYFLTGLIHAVAASVLAMSLPCKHINRMRYMGCVTPSRISRNSVVAAAKRQKRKAKRT